MEVDVNIKQPIYTIKIEENPVEVSILSPKIAVDLQSAPDVSVGISQAVLSVNLGCFGPQGPPGDSGANTLTITAGEDLAALDLIYIAADGLAYKADATDGAKEAVAIVQDEILTSAEGTAYLGQCPVTGFVGLTVNGRYFLSPDTPGAITATIPSGAAQIVQQIGKAYSATALLFGPQDSILIAAAAVVAADYRITEDGNSRITESGDYRIIEAVSTSYRITEGGDIRITEGGDARINE